MPYFNLDEIESAIYEAAIVPELWPDALAGIANAGDAEGAVLFTVGRVGMRWSASRDVRETMRRFVDEGWSQKNTRVAGVIERGLVGAPRFVTETDYLRPGQFEHDPLVQELMVPTGFGWAAGTLVALPDGDIITISVEKNYARGPIEGDGLTRLNRIRPHIARAAMFGARIALEQMRSAVEIIGALGLAAAAVTRAGKVLVANRAFEDETELWSLRGNDRVVIPDLRSNRLLYEALDRIETAGGQRSIPLRGEDKAISAIMQTLPVRKRAHDYFQRAQALLVVNRPTGSMAVDPAMVQAIFDLTAAEAGIATRLLSGNSVADIARDKGVSLNTIRSQLKSAMMKTGCYRQVDLVRLLGSLFPNLSD